MSNNVNPPANETLNLDTVAVQAGRPSPMPDGPVNPPIFASTTLHAGGPAGYQREWNETTSYLEDLLGALDSGIATVYSSGMAAANAIIDLVPVGGVIVASSHSYTGVAMRLKELQEAGRLIVRLVDVTNATEIETAIRGEGTPAHWVWLESPTNPLMEICDIRAAAHVARDVGAYLVIDSTFMTPARQRPLELGAHVVMHSVTKGLAGHSDALLGSLVTNEPELARIFIERRILMGAAPSPFDAFLAIRGIRTLAVRVDRAEENAKIIANRLLEHPSVTAVHYPGLSSHPNAHIHDTQTDGPGTVMSFEVTGGAQGAENVCGAVALMTYATSLGGVETLIERRRRWPNENKDVPESLIRLAVGIENVEDLWRDLAQALETA